MTHGFKVTEGFLDFLSTSPSSRHAAKAVAERLDREGFVRQDETDSWNGAAGGHYLVRGGAVMAWWVPETAGISSAFRIVGSHTDSPGLKLKEKPDLGRAGWQQAAVEIYGGAILHTWFDRELVLAGPVITTDGETHLVETGPLFRVPSLAIHLDRTVNDQFAPGKQAHMQPVFAVGNEGLSVLDLIAEEIGCEPDEILSHELITCTAEKPAVFGAGDQFIAAGRLDNLSSVYPSLEALCYAAKRNASLQSNDILVMAAFDHEEVGSATRCGAAGPVLEDTLFRIAWSLRATGDDAKRMFARSTCISSDAAHSVHPNYESNHDAVNRPLLGGGPALKLNANQRYATDVESAALFKRACAAADVPCQFFVSNNDMPCGSTIGPITATRLGIDTVDIGVPILSMHSAREMCSVADIDNLTAVLAAYWTNLEI